MGYLTDADTSFSVKLCEECNNCYEVRSNETKKIEIGLKENKWEAVYIIHSGFPTIGLERKTCPKCFYTNNLKDNKILSEKTIEDYIDDTSLKNKEKVTEE